jgi:hypothetical protein
MEVLQDMLSKNDMLIHCKDINESDFIIIKPKKHSQGQFVATVILMNIICFAFLFEYGFVPFIIGAILTLIGSVSSSTEFFRLVFYRDEIKFIFRNKERFFYRLRQFAVGGFFADGLLFLYPNWK